MKRKRPSGIEWGLWVNHGEVLPGEVRRKTRQLNQTANHLNLSGNSLVSLATFLLIPAEFPNQNHQKMIQLNAQPSGPRRIPFVAGLRGHRTFPPSWRVEDSQIDGKLISWQLDYIKGSPCSHLLIPEAIYSEFCAVCVHGKPINSRFIAQRYKLLALRCCYCPRL